MGWQRRRARLSQPTPSQASSGFASTTSGSLGERKAMLPRSSTTGVVGHRAAPGAGAARRGWTRALLAGHAADGAQQLFDDQRRQAFERFVQQQQAWVEHQGAAKGQHLLLATRAGCRGSGCAPRAPGRVRPHAPASGPQARHGRKGSRARSASGRYCAPAAPSHAPAPHLMMHGQVCKSRRPAECCGMAFGGARGVDQRRLARAIAADKRGATRHCRG